MRTVGLLLVSALMVVPVATSQQLTRSFRTHAGRAPWALGILASVGGLVVAALASYRRTVAPGATIVLLALAGFVVTWPLGAWLRRRGPAAPPFPTSSARSTEPTTTATASTRTSTAPTAATWRCPTATTSTTSTTATGTRPTERHYDEH